MGSIVSMILASSTEKKVCYVLLCIFLLGAVGSFLYGICKGEAVRVPTDSNYIPLPRTPEPEPYVSAVGFLFVGCAVGAVFCLIVAIVAP